MKDIVFIAQCQKKNGFLVTGYPMHRGPGIEDLHKKIFDSKTIKTISGQVIKVDQVPELGFGMEM